MAWKLIRALSVEATTSRVVLGPVVIPEGDGLALRVSAPVPVPVPSGSCLIAFESSYGRELGSVRVWPREVAEVYRLGVGLRPRDPAGVLVLEVQDFNARWLRAGFVLSVVVAADLPDPVVDGGTPAPGLASVDGADLFLSPAGESGRITFYS